MQLSQLFLNRYDALHNFWLSSLWDSIPGELMRQRPHTHVNSIVWNIWHLLRVEDAGINRFICDQPQVLDEGDWNCKMNIPWRHHGCEMTLAEVDDLNQRIDLQALQEYSKAVQKRTRQVVQGFTYDQLDEVVQEDRLRMILFDEGLAHPRAAGLLENYMGWTKGKYLMNFGLTHSFQHIGEIDVIASLLGVSFD